MTSQIIKVKKNRKRKSVYFTMRHNGLMFDSRMNYLIFSVDVCRFYNSNIKNPTELNVIAHTFSPSTLEAEVSRALWVWGHLGCSRWWSLILNKRGFTCFDFWRWCFTYVALNSWWSALLCLSSVGIKHLSSKKSFLFFKYFCYSKI